MARATRPVRIRRITWCDRTIWPPRFITCSGSILRRKCVIRRIVRWRLRMVSRLRVLSHDAGAAPAIAFRDMKEVLASLMLGILSAEAQTPLLNYLVPTAVLPGSTTRVRIVGDNVKVTTALWTSCVAYEVFVDNAPNV